MRLDPFQLNLDCLKLCIGYEAVWGYFLKSEGTDRGPEFVMSSHLGWKRLWEEKDGIMRNLAITSQARGDEAM